MDGAIGAPNGPKTHPLKFLDLKVVRSTTKREDNLPGMSSGSWYAAKSSM